MNCSAVAVENLESLGDSITSAVLLSWSKEPGDSVKEDDVIAVVETDKVGKVLLSPPPPQCT
jgi:pyruvate/2-oxoglutarate dehydrogenase complex dihydrolipoamide acyltransferase (E2) component